MKHVSRYTRRVVGVMLLGLLLAGCGAGAARETAGPTVASEQGGQADPSPTRAMIATAPATTIEPTQTTEPTRTAAPTQPAPPTDTPLPAPTGAPQPTAAHAGAHGATVQADIKLFVFRPDPLEIPPGTTVVWTNQDDIDHSVTHGTPPDPGQAFDSDFFDQGKAFSFTFNVPGEYPYFCRRHPSMVGTVRVTGN